MPLIPFGFETHHLDFPGTIDINADHLLNFVLDVTKSVAHPGFERILVADRDQGIFHVGFQQLERSRPVHECVRATGPGSGVPRVS
jgi:hypothetical protein